MVHDFHAVFRRRPFSDVLHAYKHRLPLMGREKDFPVIIAGIIFWLDVKEAKLPRV